MASNLPTSNRSMVSSSTWLMLAGLWSVFGSAAEFHHNLPMFDRFVVIYFHTDNLCDVGRLVVTKIQLPLNLLMFDRSMVGFEKINIRLSINQINKLKSIDFLTFYCTKMKIKRGKNTGTWVSDLGNSFTF